LNTHSNDIGAAMADNEPMVYVVDQQPFDYSPAAAFGTLYFMRSVRLAPSAPNDRNEWNTNAIKQLRGELRDYIPGRDYVIPTGAPTKMLLVGMLLAQLGPTHKLLGWDARAQKYHCYELEI